MRIDKSILKIIIGISFLVIVIGNIFFWKWLTPPTDQQGVMGSTELWKYYEYPQDNLTIMALDGVPEEVIAEAYGYIMANGYNDRDIKYIFINSLYRIDFPHLYDNQGSIERSYHVVECYKDALTEGGFWFNREGGLIEDEGYVKVDELEKIDTEIGIDFDKALEIAKGVSASPHQIIYDGFSFRRDSAGRIIYCYEFVFYDYAVYVDVSNGQIIQSLSW